MKIITVHKSASSGVAMGKALIYHPRDLKADTSVVLPDHVDSELRRYRSAEEKVKQQLEVLAESSEIFKAHLDLVEDPAIHDAVSSKIQDEHKNAELALEETIDSIRSKFEKVEDDFFRERVVDIQDVCTKIMCALKGIETDALKNIREKVVLVANQLAPSDLLDIDLNYITGFIMQTGGENSHVSIMARSKGIPAIVGIPGIMAQVKEGDPLILDAVENRIIICPDSKMDSIYDGKLKDYLHKKELLKSLSGFSAETTDGRNAKLCANAGGIDDVNTAVSCGAEGIGLFRTEFVYMNSMHFPTEDEQFAVYKEAAGICSGPLVIRTFDIGGDKTLPYFEFPKEDNPFLGMRAIRICLRKKDIFKVQLRAILRASAYGDIQIMYPMIISVEEFEEANRIMDECKNELLQQHIPFRQDIKVGMMVETPAAVACIDSFAKRADFFSIGTNDLTQYLLAVDRGNKGISDIYDPFHPSVVKSIKKVIEAGHKKGIPVGMCGEFAANPAAVPLLLGLGLDEFSVSASCVPEVKAIIRNLSFKDAEKYAEGVCSCDSKTEIYSFVNNRKEMYSCHL